MTHAFGSGAPQVHGDCRRDCRTLCSGSLCPADVVGKFSAKILGFGWVLQWETTQPYPSPYHFRHSGRRQCYVPFPALFGPACLMMCSIRFGYRRHCLHLLVHLLLVCLCPYVIVIEDNASYVLRASVRAYPCHIIHIECMFLRFKLIKSARKNAWGTCQDVFPDMSYLTIACRS
jgi:hypothetical protein